VDAAKRLTTKDTKATKKRTKITKWGDPSSCQVVWVSEITSILARISPARDYFFPRFISRWASLSRSGDSGPGGSFIFASPR